MCKMLKNFNKLENPQKVKEFPKLKNTQKLKGLQETQKYSDKEFE